ncbi:hypothetical protein AHF37_09537 [Paragonimus kellicotti]|nr:hypothetical protein AHF37_09537 [Paragonimus kellicotti]
MYLTPVKVIKTKHYVFIHSNVHSFCDITIKQTERELGELNAEYDVLTANYQDASEQVGQHLDALRRREMDFSRVRRELDELKEAHEETLNNLRRRHQTSMTELTSEIEGLHRFKVKAEKERTELTRQLEVAFTEAEEANKQKVF